MIALLILFAVAQRGRNAAVALSRPVYGAGSVVAALFAAALPASIVYARSPQAATVTKVYSAACIGIGLFSALHAFVLRRHRTAIAAHPIVAARPPTLWSRFRHHRLAGVASVVLVLLVEVSLLGGLFEAVLGVSHTEPDVNNIYAPAAWPHLFGTDDVGQDVFLRLIFGGRISLAVGIISALSSALIGTIIGLTAGYLGGRIDTLLMRFVDGMLAIPVLPLMIVFSAVSLDAVLSSIDLGLIVLLSIGASLMWWAAAAVFGSGEGRAKFDALYLSPLYAALVVGAVVWAVRAAGGEGSELASVVKIIVIIVMFGWMTVARLARAAALTLRDRDFVVAARALGASRRRVLLAHVLPSAVAPVIVAATLEVGGNILYEAALSYLGLGVQPPVPSWGNMLKSGLIYVRTDHALLAVWPGLLILVTVVCFNLFGDGMRDALDPHQVMRKKR